MKRSCCDWSSQTGLGELDARLLLLFQTLQEGVRALDVVLAVQPEAHAALQQRLDGALVAGVDRVLELAQRLGLVVQLGDERAGAFDLLRYDE